MLRPPDAPLDAELRSLVHQLYPKKSAPAQGVPQAGMRTPRFREGMLFLSHALALRIILLS
jgi:hypothetical protein